MENTPTINELIDRIAKLECLISCSLNIETNVLFCQDLNELNENQLRKRKSTLELIVVLINDSFSND